ncbi:MAG: hypothetical protein V1779_10885 [bacterium]
MIEIQDLKNLCINASRNLVEMLNERDGFKGTLLHPNLETKMIFPIYELEITGDKGDVRISEQEARFQFCLAIERYYKEIFYSVETPTKYNYSFSGKDDENKNIKKLQIFKPEPKNPDVGMSARFDMSLFERNLDNKFEQVCDIEFKLQSPDKEQIEKDLLKLFAEAKAGVFFHFVYNNRKHAFQNDLIKFQKSADDIFNKFNLINIKGSQDIKDDFNKQKTILFAFFLLDLGELHFKEFWHNKTTRKSNDFFSYEDPQINEKNGWESVKL